MIIQESHLKAQVRGWHKRVIQQRGYMLHHNSCRIRWNTFFFSQNSVFYILIYWNSVCLTFCIWKCVFPSFFTRASGRQWSLHVFARFKSTLCEQNSQNSVSPDAQKSFEKCLVRNFFFSTFCSVFADFAGFFGRECLWSYVSCISISISISNPPTMFSPDKRLSRFSWKQNFSKAAANSVIFQG